MSTKKPPPPAPDRRDEHNNPVWSTNLPADVIRMDNSMSMTMHAGEFKDKRGRVIGTVAKAVGGFVFVVTDEKTKQHLAINFKDAIEKVFGERKQYADALEMKHPKSITKKRKRA